MTYIVREKITLMLTTIALFFGASQVTFAHCQIPCGIYDDHAEVKSMMQDVVTIDKAIKLITELSGKDDAQSNNQLVRWVFNKEKHADQIIDTISNYFLTQRVKSSQEDYQTRLVKHHAVIVSAMKVKQNVDPKLADQLLLDVQALLAYYPEHKHKK